METNETEAKLAKIFSNLAYGERKSEISRQMLCDNLNFNPYQIFKLLDVENKNYIDKTNIINYMNSKGIPVTDLEAQLLILFYDCNYDRVLSFCEFLNIIKSEKIKGFRNVKVIDNNPLNFNISYSFDKLLENEIELAKKIIKLLNEIKNDKDIDIHELYHKVKVSDFIDEEGIKNFLDKNFQSFLDTDIKAIIKRLDFNKDGIIDLCEFHAFLGFPKCYFCCPCVACCHCGVCYCKKCFCNYKCKYHKKIHKSHNSPMKNFKKINDAEQKNIGYENNSNSKYNYNNNQIVNDKENLDNNIDKNLNLTFNNNNLNNSYSYNLNSNINDGYNNTYANGKYNYIRNNMNDDNNFNNNKFNEINSNNDNYDYNNVNCGCNNDINNMDEINGNFEYNGNMNNNNYNFENNNRNNNGNYKGLKTKTKRILYEPPKGRKYKKNISNNSSLDNSINNNDNSDIKKVSKTLSIRQSPERKKGLRNSNQEYFGNNSLLNNENIKNNNNLKPYNQDEYEEDQFNDFLGQMMDAESQIETIKVRLALRPDFNCEDCFRIFEVDQKGNLDNEDFKTGLKLIGVFYTDFEIKLFFKRFDLQKKGYINYSDFFDIFVPFQKEYRTKVEERKPNSCCPCRCPDVFCPETIALMKNLLDIILKHENNLNFLRRGFTTLNLKLRNIFKNIDTSKSGYFSNKDLEEYLKKKSIYNSDLNKDLLFIRLDKNRNGKIDYQEIYDETHPLYL